MVHTESDIRMQKYIQKLNEKLCRLDCTEPLDCTELGTFFFHFEKDVELLVREWTQYHYLFVENEERYNFLFKDTNPSEFFYLQQWIMIEHIVISVARLLDPADTPIRKTTLYNGSINRLNALLLTATMNGDRLKNIKSSIDKITNAYCHLKKIHGQLKTLRDKQIAHRDSATISGACPIELPMYKEVGEIIDALWDIVEVFQSELLDTSVLRPSIPLRGAQQLLWLLHIAQTELAKLHAGEIDSLPNKPEWLRH
jgi:AbiU2